MKRSRILIAVFALVIPAGADHAASDSGDDLVLARVNGEAITLQDLRDSLGERHSGNAGPLTGEDVIDHAVDGAVEERLLVQEGRRMGFHRKPAFESAIAVTRDTLLLEALEECYLRKGLEAGDEEIQRAYDLLHRQVRVGLIETRDADDARTARLRIIGGEAFDALARQISIHGSRGQGGDLGWVTWGILDPATEKAALETAPGAVSEPFAVDEGRYRIVSVSDEKAGYPPAKEKAIDRIRAIIVSREQHGKRRSLLEEIRRTHPPAMDEAAVRKLVSSLDPGRDGASVPDDPDDATIVMTTATGLPVSAGYIRERARKSGLSLQAAWVASRDDALLIDEARRRIQIDDEIRRKLEMRTDQRVRAEVENAALGGVQMTEEAVLAVYDQDPNAFAGPVSYRIRHIVLSTREDALEVHKILGEGGDFGKLVSERSVDLRTKDRGGDLGWVDVVEEDSIDEVRRAIFALTPGQHTGVMKTMLGYEIVQVLSIRPPLVPPFEQVRDAAARIHFSKQAASLRDALIARLREEATIEKLEANIASAIEIQDRLATKGMDGGSGRRCP